MVHQKFSLGACGLTEWEINVPLSGEWLGNRVSENEMPTDSLSFLY